MTADNAATTQADVAAAIREYLTDETDASSPSLHATALALRLAELLARARAQERLSEVELWIDRLSYVEGTEQVRDLLRKRRGTLSARVASYRIPPDKHEEGS